MAEPPEWKRLGASEPPTVIVRVRAGSKYWNHRGLIRSAVGGIFPAMIIFVAAPTSGLP